MKTTPAKRQINWTPLPDPLREEELETHNAQARYVAELVKASGVKQPGKVEIECGRLVVTGSDFRAEYFKFVAAAQPSG